MFLHDPAKQPGKTGFRVAPAGTARHITAMRYSIDELCDLIDRHGRASRNAVAIPELRLQHAVTPNPSINTIYRPSLCLVAQGNKRVLLNDRVFDYDPSQYLIVTVDLPVTGCIVDASPAHPYLGLALDLDPGLIADLLLELAEDDRDLPPTSGLSVGQLDEDLLGAVVRMLQLLDRPADAS